MIEDEEYVSIDHFFPFILLIIASISILYFIYKSEISIEEYITDINNRILYIKGKIWLWMNMEGNAIKVYP